MTTLIVWILLMMLVIYCVDQGQSAINDLKDAIDKQKEHRDKLEAYRKMQQNKKFAEYYKK